MRYYSYNEYDEDDDDKIITLSEFEIKKTYWPYWYSRMCQKFGKEVVDLEYSFEDCLVDWIVVNWAWESTTEITGKA